MDLYIDAVDDAGAYDGTGGALAYSGSPAAIGRFLSSYFHGRIDEVYLYSRALSQAEVEEIFLAGPAPQPVPAFGLVGLASLGILLGAMAFLTLAGRHARVPPGGV